MMTSSTKELTADVKAAPMTMPTARSITLPRAAVVVPLVLFALAACEARERIGPGGDDESAAIVYGTVRRQAPGGPMAGVIVRVFAHEETCAGRTVAASPSATTDAFGAFRHLLEAEREEFEACLAVEVDSDPLTVAVDTTVHGITIRFRPASQQPDSVRVDIAF